MLNKTLFNDKTALDSFTSKVWRMVETQETVATLNVVDSMEEQDLLEELLDNIKPPYRPGTQGMHYLLKTAFRYPPLKYGSRFGTSLMPSFFYASSAVETVLAETAYYRFVFLSDMREEYSKGFVSNHSMFSVTVRSDQCLDLRSGVFSTIHDDVASVRNYALCQSIGEWAVNEKKVEIIHYESARKRGGSNVAIAEPKAIRSRSPIAIHSWLCRTSTNKISFSSRDARFPTIYSIDDFLVDGQLPRPA